MLALPRPIGLADSQVIRGVMEGIPGAFLFPVSALVTEVDRSATSLGSMPGATRLSP